MAVKFFDNVRQAVASVDGGGVITFGAAPTSWQSFSDAGAVDGDQPPYRIDQGDDWEIGYLTLGNSVAEGTRTVVDSSDSGSPLTLTGGELVTCVPLAQDLMANIGEFVWWPGAIATVPSNLIALDGTQEDVADYPFLWALANDSFSVVTGGKTDADFLDNEDGTFDKPDLTGDNRYIRAADGSTIAVGALQDHQMQDHVHDPVSGTAFLSNQGGFPIDNGGPGSWGSSGNTSNPITGNHGAETRPITIAYTPCMRAR